MDSQTLTNVAKVPAPFRINTVTGQGEINLAVSGTHWTYLVPDWMTGKYVEFTASGASVDVLFSDATCEVVYNQATGESSGTLTCHAKTGRKVPDGTTRGWVVSQYATHWSVEASAAGFISVAASSQKLEK